MLHKENFFWQDEPRHLCDASIKIKARDRGVPLQEGAYGRRDAAEVLRESETSQSRLCVEPTISSFGSLDLIERLDMLSHDI